MVPSGGSGVVAGSSAEFGYTGLLMGPTDLINAATFEGEVVDPAPMDV